MAIQLAKQNSKFNSLHQHFYIDNLSDLDSIETQFKCQMGDIAELPDGAQYQRHSDDYSGQKWEYWQGGSASGSELPEVDSSDNGKFLKVVNSEWSKGSMTMNYGQAYYTTILDTTTVTTVNDGTYNKYENFCSLASFSNGDAVRVTFDGTTYTLNASVSRYGKHLGDSATNYLHYPFYISTASFPDNATLCTKEAGEHTIKIEKKVINITQDFRDAALTAIKYVKFMTTQLSGGTLITCNYSRDEVWDMFEDESPVIASIDGVLCAQGMKYLHPNMVQFRVLDFTNESNIPVLKERIISVNEYNTPEFSYSENYYDLTTYQPK